MSLSSKTELARALFRTPSPDSVTRISGTATADSADGTVTVQLEDGDVIEVGTIGSVSAGDTVTIHVQRGEAQVIASEGWGDAMQAAVDEAAEVANAVNQHFWSDTNGAHVTEVTQEQWQQSQTGHNILVNSLGILLRKALNYIAAWTGSALSFYDGDGNAASNVTASFGSAGAQIGKTGESHIEMDYHSMRLIDKDGNEFFKVEDFRDQSGEASIVETWVGDGTTTVFALSYMATGTGYTVSVNGTVASTTNTDHGFTFPTAPVSGAVIMADYRTIEAVQSMTFGTRDEDMPVGASSVTEGYFNTASGVRSHAGGDTSTASGNCSFAHGAVAKATGFGSHAEGIKTEASGDYSHAQNDGTIAQGEAQTAIGKYNVADSTSALIIGNGTGGAPSNALTVDWSGNVEAAGDVMAGGSTPLVPIGTILDFAAATAPTGYLVCDGSAVSRSTYAALFAVIGTTWGSGNGSTTFNIPDFRGRTAIGAGTGTASDATAHALGSNGGTETHKLTHAQSGVPAHSHPLPNSAIVYNADGTQRLATSGSGTKSSVNTNVGLSTASNTAADASSAHPNMQPYAAVTKIIRAI